jgi:hypothetical protein
MDRAVHDAALAVSVLIGNFVIREYSKTSCPEQVS